MYVRARVTLLRATFMVSLLLLRSQYFLNAVRKSLLFTLLPLNGLSGLPMSPPMLGGLPDVPDNMVCVGGGDGGTGGAAAAGVMFVGIVPPCKAVLMIVGRIG